METKSKKTKKVKKTTDKSNKKTLEKKVSNSTKVLKGASKKKIKASNVIVDEVILPPTPKQKVKRLTKNELQENLNEAAKELEKANNEIIALKEKVSKAESKIDYAKGETKMYVSANRIYQNQIEELTEKVKKTELSNQSYKAANTKAKKQSNKVAKEAWSLRKEIQAIIASKKVLMEERNLSKEVILDLDKENEILSEKLNSCDPGVHFKHFYNALKSHYGKPTAIAMIAGGAIITALTLAAPSAVITAIMAGTL